MAQCAIRVPKQIGPCQFGELGAMTAVRRPVELAHNLRRAALSGSQEAASGGSCSDAGSGR